MANLLEGRIEQTVGPDPGHDDPQTCGGAHSNESGGSRPTNRMRIRAELVDTADRGARIVHGGGNCLERDVDDLDDAELDVLLQRARRPDVERRA